MSVNFSHGSTVASSLRSEETMEANDRSEERKDGAVAAIASHHQALAGIPAHSARLMMQSFTCMARLKIVAYSVGALVQYWRWRGAP